MKIFWYLFLPLIWISLCGFTPRVGRHFASGSARAVTVGVSFDEASSKHSLAARVGKSNESYRHIESDLDFEFGKIMGPFDLGLNLSSLWYMSNLDIYYSILSVGVLGLGAGAEIGFVQSPYLLATVNLGGFFISLKPRFVIYAAGSNWGNGFDESGLYALNGVLALGMMNLFGRLEISAVLSDSHYLGSGFEWFNYSDIYDHDFYDVPRIPIYNSGTIGLMAGLRF
ncbi:MAG: hypothetical protein JWQ35_1195 [Bacteriovoracaceae bacterium]|nr:hypothetical protein [Bacteriovoracaceae bacterium]